MLTRRELFEELWVVSESCLNPLPVAGEDHVVVLLEVPREGVLTGLLVTVFRHRLPASLLHHHDRIGVGGFLAYDAVAHCARECCEWIG
jgi:hypothetical protein